MTSETDCDREDEQVIEQSAPHRVMAPEEYFVNTSLNALISEAPHDGTKASYYRIFRFYREQRIKNYSEEEQLKLFFQIFQNIF